MNTTYEWDIETMDGDDIVDHNHSDRIPCAPLLENEVLVLVRDNRDDGRLWAYVIDGKLSPWMMDAYENEVRPTPQRYLKEFAKSIHAK